MSLFNLLWIIIFENNFIYNGNNNKKKIITTQVLGSYRIPFIVYTIVTMVINTNVYFYEEKNCLSKYISLKHVLIRIINIKLIKYILILFRISFRYTYGYIEVLLLFYTFL